MSSEKDKKPKVNEELKGFDLKVNSFGEIKSNIDIDDINSFLNRNVEDKKLKDREDIGELKRKKSKD